ncbi:Uncharacterized membrane protein [Thermoflexus hugenholtzii JAD2]|uniref:Uncharacterized membrane protein n=1 Tax=Thermoflexus hugenholtzii JAD2 TaxID=877466 RepID=A0A212REC4_9CHLR|nr:Uncharacterized membrane protein [Thermoflexus hugenholtzii JAD2]
MGLLLLLAFGLRLYRLGEPSLWGDEGLSLYRARASWEELLRGRIVLRGLQPIETIDNHPPLYFAVLKAWVGLAGDSEFALRFPSVFASILLIPLAWATGRRLREPAAAWAGAALTAASPLYLWYAQEARMYTLLALESGLLLFLLLPSRHGTSLGLRRQIAALVTLLAMILTHYTAFLLVPALGLWALGQPRRDLPRLLAGFGIMVVLMLPFTYLAAHQWVEGKYFVPSFSDFYAILFDVFRASILGFEIPDYGTLNVLLLLIWIVIMVIGLINLVKIWRLGIYILFLIVLPIAEIYLMAYIRPIYQTVRHLFFVIPFVYFVCSKGFFAISKLLKGFSYAIYMSILGGMFLNNWHYLANSYPSRQSLREALVWINQNASPEDVLVLQDLALTPLADYYYQGTAKLFLIGQQGEGQEALIHRLEGWPRPIERIWLVTGLSSEDLARPEQALYHWLGRRGRYLSQEVFPSRNVWIRVLVYDFSSPGCAPSPRTSPTGVGFGAYFRLRGFEVEPSSPFLRARFFWEKGSASSLNLWLGIQLVDEAGTVWVREVQPIWPSYPPDRWPEGEPVCQQVRLRLPPGLPPGRYRLRVEAFDLDRRIPADGGPVWESPFFALEGYTERFSLSPIARSAGGLQLLSAQPEVGPPYFPGLGIPLWLRWQAEASPPVARMMALFWQQGGERRLLLRGQLGPSSFPADRWRAGQVVAQRIWVPLPPDLRGYGQIRLALYDEAGRELPWDAFWPFYRRGYPVLSVSLSSWPVRRKPIPLAREGGACFVETVCLDRYEIQPEGVAPGGIVEVRLAWHVRRRPERPGVVFVHLTQRPDQAPWATGDGPPQGGQRPIVTWEPGEYVEDIHTLRIPEDLPAGRYAIFVGWYSEEGRWMAVDPSGARYRMDAVPLGEIEVRP